MKRNRERNRDARFDRLDDLAMGYEAALVPLFAADCRILSVVL